MNSMISIIVAVYNIERYLPQCLDSIATQTFKDWECIVVDDGSTDGSGRICDEWASRDKRFKVIHQANKGLSCARNTGIEAATGKYIAFVDGDDYLHPRMYELLVQAAEEHDCELVMTRGRSINEDDLKVYEINGSPTTSILSEDEMVKFSFMPHLDVNFFMGYAWNKLYRKSLIGTERYRDVVCEDMDLNLRLYPQCNHAVLVNAEAYYYRHRGGSISHSPEFLLDAIPTKAQFFVEHVEGRGYDCEATILRYLFRRICFIKQEWLNTTKQSLAFERAADAYRLIKHRLKDLGLVKSLYLRIAYNYPWFHRLVLKVKK